MRNAEYLELERQIAQADGDLDKTWRETEDALARKPSEPEEDTTDDDHTE